MRARRFTFLDAGVYAAAIASLALMGCESSSTSSRTPAGPAGQEFVSENPQNNGSGYNEGDNAGAGTTGTGAGAGGSGGGGGGNVADPGGEEAERAIAEADIVQVKDGRLYALSQYSGLSIIDVSVRDQLHLVGSYETTGTPFEMYVRDGIVYAMYSSWGDYLWDEATQSYTWIQTSRIVALDVADPANVVALGTFDMPGIIQDSRIVGDVLYAVTFEDGYCYGCENYRNTTVTSLQVGTASQIGVIDQLRFADVDLGYGWKKSISVTPDRMYVAGIEWSGSESDLGHSTIQVVDISDPAGDLVLGTSVEAEGEITNRWQMDEHEGVLRVISQPGIWWGGEKPVVQTFSVESSDSLVPLGRTEITLPMPETLRSVRFDGARAYAITAVQQDPLFTIDLADPAAPVVRGELEMPGWVYHMEPRGDRLLALGFDNTNAGASLAVSLFDVSDLDNPTMIERVHFGGDWASVAEDQDRIHKAFTIRDDLGLIMVPYFGWDYGDTGDGYYYCGSYDSGVQLIDFDESGLDLRGAAETRGFARRAFLHDERLFAVSDESVRTFDVANRDVPAKKAELVTATVVNKAVEAGDLVIRVNADWWTTQARLEIVPADAPGAATPIGVLDLDEVLDDDACYGWGWYTGRIFVEGQHAFVVLPTADYTTVRVASIDFTDPTAPTVKGTVDVPATAWASGYYGWGGYYGYGYGYDLLTSGDAIVKLDGALAFLRIDQNQQWDGDPNDLEQAFVEIVDLTDPDAPTHAKTVTLPHGAGHTPLVASGSTILSTHWVPLDEDPTKAKFYLDRIDASTPAAAVNLEPVNVPGSLVSWDAASGRLLTMDYQPVVLDDVDYQTCWNELGYSATFEPSVPEDYESLGTCTGRHRSFKLASVVGDGAFLLDSLSIPLGSSTSAPLLGDDRVFVGISDSDYGEYGDYYSSSFRWMVLAGMDAGALQMRLEARPEAIEGYAAGASGTSLVLLDWYGLELRTLDTSDLDAMTITAEGSLSSWPYDVSVSGDRAYASLGPYGVEVVELGQ